MSGTDSNALTRVLLLAGGALFSFQVKTRFASVFEAFQTFLSFFQGALFALLLFGMLTRRATAPEASPECWSASPPS